MINYNSTDFFHQVLSIEEIENKRFDFFVDICKNDKILHIGCADSLHYNKDCNLHLYLLDNGIEVDGYDIDKELLDILKSDAGGGNFYNNFEDIENIEYDLVLIPEVLEHVENARTFLDEIFSINSKRFFITVPNCEIYAKHMNYNDGKIVELIHPDHKYWFSPYTLFNLCRKYIKDMNANLYYLEKRSMIGIEIFKK